MKVHSDLTDFLTLHNKSLSGPCLGTVMHCKHAHTHRPCQLLKAIVSFQQREFLGKCSYTCYGLPDFLGIQTVWYMPRFGKQPYAGFAIPVPCEYLAIFVTALPGKPNTSYKPLTCEDSRRYRTQPPKLVCIAHSKCPTLSQSTRVLLIWPID